MNDISPGFIPCVVCSTKVRQLQGQEYSGFLASSLRSLLLFFPFVEPDEQGERGKP